MEHSLPTTWQELSNLIICQGEVLREETYCLAELEGFAITGQFQ